MGGPEDRLGELLVGDHIVTWAQLNHALQIQKEQEDRQRLGQILIELGYVTRRKLRRAIKQHGKHILFGELLVESGRISPGQLDEALEEQPKSGRRLGDILVDKGMIDEDQLAQALGNQMDVPT